MMNNTRWRSSCVLLCSAWALLACEPARGAGEGSRITYDAEARILQVAGFRAEDPATAAKLYAADRDAGWGVVRPLEEGLGFEIKASLWIGDEDGSSTVFQIGGARAPGEILELAGDLWVRPSAEQRATNRLRAGDPDRPDERTKLRIRCEEPEQYGLMVGQPRNSRTFGELLLYYTDIEALDQPLRGGMSSRGPGGWFVKRLEIVGCRIAGIASRATYGPGFPYLRGAVWRDTVIKNCEWAFSLGDRIVERCVFRNNEIALERAMGTYIDCRLEGNMRDIAWPPRGTIFWIDTGQGLAGPPPDFAQTRDIYRDPLPDAIPVLTEYRLVIFELVTADGTPVAGARLKIMPHPVDPAAVQAFPPIVTDAQGRTSDDLLMDAVLLARAHWYRQDGSETIERVPFRYEIHVNRPGEPVVVFERDEDDLARPGIWRFTLP